MATGIRKRGESYEAWVWSNRDKKKLRKTFTGKGALSAAKNWRADALKPVREGTLRAPVRTTLSEAWDEWLAGAEAGAILNRQRKAYKPGVLRLYETSMRLRVLPELGQRRLADIATRDLLELKERMQGDGCSASQIRNSFVPMQALYRRARRNGTVDVNPALDLELPTPEGRDRAATPSQAAEIIAALPEDDRALWATAFYAGLRRGELRALRVVDVNETCLHVEYGWDDKHGQQGPKSLAGRRDVPLTETLRQYLLAHLERTGRSGEDLVFGRTAVLPFTPNHLSDRAYEALAALVVGRFLRGENARIARWTLHEARHSFSTWLDAAGISEERSDRYMGHSRGGVASRYRHLLPGQLAEDAAKLDAYLSGAAAGKVVALGATG